VEIENRVDNAAGIIDYAVSLQAPSPAVSGTGRLATVTFHGIGVGTTSISYTTLLLSDPDANLISSSVQPGEIRVGGQPCGWGSVEGQVDLQGQSGGSDARVTLGGQAVTTGDTGEYHISDVPVAVLTINVSRTSYLRAFRPVTITHGQTTLLPKLKLLGGDCNNDDGIDLLDAIYVGAAWRSAPPSNARADITADGVVDIRDMVLVQGNWKKTASGPWPGKQTPDLRSVNSTARVVISPTTAWMPYPGDTYTFDIRIEDVSNLYGASVVIAFDPQVVQVEDADPTIEGVQIAIGDFLDQRQFVLKHDVNNDTGYVELSITQLSPAPLRQRRVCTLYFAGGEQWREQHRLCGRPSLFGRRERGEDRCDDAGQPRRDSPAQRCARGRRRARCCVRQCRYFHPRPHHRRHL
jgi:hypothetical protein